MFFKRKEKKETQKAIELNEQNFQELVLQSDIPVLVDFWAGWCGPCKIMGPIMDELAEEYKDKPVRIGKVNVEASERISATYGIRSIPTFILFKGGKPVSMGTGLVPKYDLEEVIEANMQDIKDKH